MIQSPLTRLRKDRCCSAMMQNTSRGLSSYVPRQYYIRYSTLQTSRRQNRTKFTLALQSIQFLKEFLKEQFPYLISLISCFLIPALRLIQILRDTITIMIH